MTQVCREKCPSPSQRFSQLVSRLNPPRSALPAPLRADRRAEPRVAQEDERALPRPCPGRRPPSTSKTHRTICRDSVTEAEGRRFSFLQMNFSPYLFLVAEGTGAGLPETARSCLCAPPKGPPPPIRHLNRIWVGSLPLPLSLPFTFTLPSQPRSWGSGGGDKWPQGS